MNRITLTAAALFVAMIANATTPATGHKAKTAFNTPVKIKGAATLPGMVSATPMHPSAPAAGLMRSFAKTYDPATVAEVKYAADQKQPVSFKSKKIVAADNIKTTADAQSVAIQFLNDYKPLLSINSPKDEFIVKSFEKDELGFTHVKMTQTYMGKTVWGKEIYLHFGPAGSSVNGRWAMTASLPALASAITPQAAIAAAVQDANPATMSAATNQLLKYTGPTSDLVMYPQGLHNAKDRWAYRITVRPNFVDLYEYFVDASTGEIVSKTNISCTTGNTQTTLTDLNGVSQTVKTYQAANNTYYMIDATQPMFDASQSQMPDNPVGAIWTVNANDADASNIQVQQLTSPDDNTWTSSATAASAALNGTTAYTYYRQVHGRNSIDGSGGTIISVINVDEDGHGMDNAFWNGQLMAYGNGQTYFKPLAGGLDVAGHEMTHGVIAATANLEYKDQSGALNESMADVFGTQIGNTPYTIGATVTLPAFNSQQILRSLSDPHNNTTQGNNGWQPAVMSEYVTGTDDNGGVHTNSGIPNHAFYYFATAIGRSTADSIYYRALTKYLVTGSQFLDARLAIVNSATDLYGAGSLVVHAAGAAFDSVGIFDGVPTTSVDTASVNGADYIIYQSNDNTQSNVLYLIPAGSPATPTGLTNLTPLYRASVSDDGSNAYFVATDHYVYDIAINATGTSTTTQITALDSVWDFVSVARDKSKLALISKFVDTAIYVYDFAQSTSKMYHLYDPTFSQGITTNGPIYAGTADWDPTSQYVIYDEYNQLQSTDGTDISYWDIGLMKVWDNGQDGFDSGQISKLANSLPDGVSIGNPVYSKNHANIIAFDYLDTSGAYDAKGADLYTGAIGTMLSGNSIPNVPSFSGADDQITFTFTDQANVMNIGTQPLATDIIDGNGNVNQIVNVAQNSVWFRIGERQGVGVHDVTTDNVKLYPVPASDKLIISMTDNAEYTTVQLTDITGRIVLSQPLTSKTQQINVSSLTAGVYIIRLKDETGAKTYTSRVVKN